MPKTDAKKVEKSVHTGSFHFGKGFHGGEPYMQLTMRADGARGVCRMTMEEFGALISGGMVELQVELTEYE